MSGVSDLPVLKRTPEPGDLVMDKVGGIGVLGRWENYPGAKLIFSKKVQEACVPVQFKGAVAARDLGELLHLDKDVLHHILKEELVTVGLQVRKRGARAMVDFLTDPENIGMGVGTLQDHLSRCIPRRAKRDL